MDTGEIPPQVVAASYEALWTLVSRALYRTHVEGKLKVSPLTSARATFLTYFCTSMGPRPLDKSFWHTRRSITSLARLAAWCCQPRRADVVQAFWSTHAGHLHTLYNLHLQ